MAGALEPLTAEVQAPACCWHLGFEKLLRVSATHVAGALEPLPAEVRVLRVAGT